jgi:phage terminase large subunit GpA-like protein
MGYFGDAEKDEAVANGKWIATAPFKGTAGFHINSIYSPWVRLKTLVREFLEAKDDQSQLQVFINTRLGEVWEAGHKAVNDEMLAKRAEVYPAPLPARVLVLTAGVDTQPDRLEVEVIGWGAGEESWSIDYKVFIGDPDIPEGSVGSPWTALTDYLRKAWDHEWGLQLSVSAACIDSGGHNTQEVYNFAKRHKGDRWFAVKGKGGEGLPVIGTPNRKRTGKMVKRKVDLHIVGVDGAKNIVYNRLGIDTPGAGYCHFPVGREIEYYKQLTAERMVVKFVKGFPKREWHKPDGRRNEALDCRVYGFAALTLVAPQFDKIAYRMRAQRDTLKPKEEPKALQVEPEAAPLVEDLVEEAVEAAAVALGEKPAEDPETAKPQNVRKLKPRRERSGFINAWRR